VENNDSYTARHKSMVDGKEKETTLHEKEECNSIVK